MKFPSSTLKNRAIKPVLFCVGVFLLLALVYKVGFEEILKAVSGARMEIAALGVLAYIAVISIRSSKWFLLARAMQEKIGFWKFVPLYLTNSLVGNLTPFKSGEATTPFLFKKYLKMPVCQGFSLIVFDRFFELMAFILFLISALFYLLNQQIQNSLVLFIFCITLIALFILLALLAVVVVSKGITLKMVKFFKIPNFIEKELDGFYNALSLLKNKKIWQSLAILTIISWIFEIAAFYLVFSSVFQAPVLNIAASHIIGGAVASLAFVPAGIGVNEISVVSVMSLFNYPFALITAGALLADIFLTGTLFITGLAGVLLIRRQDITPE